MFIKCILLPNFDINMNDFRNNNSRDENEDNTESHGLVRRNSGDEEREKQISNNEEVSTQNVTVRIKTMDETEKRIQVNLEENVLDLKHKIRDQMNVPLEKQRLIFLGKQLKDEIALKEYKIKEDVCILLVANRVQNEAPRPNRENAEGSNDTDFRSFIFNALNETAQMRRNRRLLFQQNARSFLWNLRLNTSQSRETIVQNLESTDLLLKSRKDLEEVK